MSTLKTVLRFFASRRFWTGAFILSSTGIASAMVVTPQDDHSEAWMQLRHEIETSRSDAGLSIPVERLLGRLSQSTEYNVIIAMSYSVAQPGEIVALDTFWTSYLAKRRDDAGFAELMRVRARALGTGGMDRQSYLENWLYLAQDGQYDCQGGGGGNCGVGQGGGGGNGTGNEGNGQGSNP